MQELELMCIKTIKMVDKVLIILVSCTILLFICLILFHSYFVKRTVHTLSFNLPKGLSIVHISDLHGKVRFLNGRLSSLVLKSQPDLLFITGDLTTNPKQLELVIKELQIIKDQKVPIFFVPGNYEREFKSYFRKQYYSKEEAHRRDHLLSEYLTILENQGQSLKINGVSLYLYGFDNSIYGNENYCCNVDNEKHDLVCFLAHSPNIISYINKENLDFNLLFVGHTHGGQIRFFNRTIGPYKKFHVGLKKLNNHQYFFITAGIGTVKLPIRFNCNPEIAIFHIR